MQHNSQLARIIHPANTMNLATDTTSALLMPLESLTFEDVAPFLCLTSSSPGKMHFPPEETTLNKKEVPGKLDILLGRDKVAFSHIGNERFRVIVAMNRERYQSCSSKDAKTRITSEIIKGIHECGGRFLKFNEMTKTYEEVDYKEAHEKVSHALRSAKDPAEKKAPRKKKTIVRKPPTPQENKAFDFLYTEQQKIFHEMLAENSK